MPVVELAAGVLDDFDRIFDHLAKWDVQAAPSRIAEIRKALDILCTSPMIGRPVRGGKRELVIGRGARGYVAQYRYLEGTELVVVLHIRSQREAGFTPKR
jgi:toxin ParE1/3/4